MKSTGQQRKTNPVSSTKNKASSGISQVKLRAFDAKVSKQCRKMEGNIMQEISCLHCTSSDQAWKPNIELFGEPLLHSNQSLGQQNQVASSSFQKITPGNSLTVQGHRPQHFGKLKLQLFPLDEVTCGLLEKGKYNPYLELTLGIRKKIASVIKHLNTKWVNSIPTSGELMLFPYDACPENMSCYRKWTAKDFSVCAGDVYDAVGSPAVFRLRYAWFSVSESGHHATTLSAPQFNFSSQNEQNQIVTIPEEQGEPHLLSHQESGPDLPVSSLIQDAGRTPATTMDMTTSRTVDNALLLWAECLSNISVGALLSEAVANPDANRSRSMLQNNSTLQHALVNFDSFDAAIAAHIARYQVADMPAKPASQPILEAEDTCHAFPFQKITPVQATADSCNVAHFTSCAQNISSNSVRPAGCSAEANPLKLQTDGGAVQDLETASHPQTEGVACKEPTAGLQAPLEIPCDAKSDFERIDNHWSESRGPWLNGSNSSKLMISTDSTSISNLLACSMDAFQNWSLF
ncbi:TSL-kinase interacting protein 1-like [Dioscorea cayenensis subsp. rotundata]|uniref:TSL-kinase interacting protein 1-like n=1 Tax=Dioscorea cayennensis subsp. rotundata TaxID=55577 RepID=A0AB40B8M7_DIOCR|nr:TSL-kinase interacting protein 1-like [Dioscorea cayenensis subsp. rotundata]